MHVFWQLPHHKLSSSDMRERQEAEIKYEQQQQQKKKAQVLYQDSFNSISFY